MNAEQFNDKLIELGACEEGREFCEGKSLQEFWETCERGDWMLWLFRRADNYEFRILTLAKGHCANTVRHLMKDERSIKAVDAAISFGEGLLSETELYSAAASAAYSAAYYAAYAAADYAADYAADAMVKNRITTAEICRKYLPLPKFNL